MGLFIIMGGNISPGNFPVGTFSASTEVFSSFEKKKKSFIKENVEQSQKKSTIRSEIINQISLEHLANILHDSFF